MIAAFGVSNSEGRYHYEMRKVPKPSLENLPPGSVLIRTVATSICGSDFFGKNSADWRRPLEYLKTAQGFCGGSGHEIIGDIVDVVKPCKLCMGQRVLAMSSIYIQIVADLRCEFEKETNVKASVLPKQGGFAEFFVSHTCTCFPIPSEPPYKGFDPLWYVLAQPIGTVVHACKKLNSVIGRNIAILGQGQNGLIMTQMIAGMGAKRIIAIDLLPERLEVSKKFKATHTILFSKDNESVRKEVEEITEGNMCDLVVEMVGHQNKTIELCTQLSKEGGSVLLFGLPPAEDEPGMTITMKNFHGNTNFICSHSPSKECFQLAIEFLEQGRFDPSPIFTHRMPFAEDFPEAFDMASEYKNGVIKILVTFDRSNKAVL